MFESFRFGGLDHTFAVSRLIKEFPKIGVAYFGVLIIRILLFRVLTILGAPIFGNSHKGL